MNNSTTFRISTASGSFECCITSEEYYPRQPKTVKQIIDLDKKRIGFKPEKVQNQWSRISQNSGNNIIENISSESLDIQLFMSSEEAESPPDKFYKTAHMPLQELQQTSADSSTISEKIGYTWKKIKDPSENVHNYPISKIGNKMYISIPNQTRTQQHNLCLDTSSLETGNKNNNLNNTQSNNESDDSQGDCADEIGDSLRIEI